jgi:hypothetical protein
VHRFSAGIFRGFDRDIGIGQYLLNRPRSFLDDVDILES